MAFCISEKYVNHHSVCPEMEGRGRNAYETVDAGGTFFVHLSDILLPRIIKLAILGVFTSHVAQDTVWGQKSLKMVHMVCECPLVLLDKYRCHCRRV